MKFHFFKTTFFLMTTVAIASASTASAEAYRVTIQNLTANQIFTGIHARSHSSRSPLFKSGEFLPESSLLFFQSGLFLTEPASVSVPPGATITFPIDAKRRQRFFSLICPLHATDDGFVGIESIPLPTKRKRIVTVLANAYDAGLFDNTESCEGNTLLTSLRPPEECSQTPTQVTLQPNSPIVIHNGIHGIEDISPAKYDWKNPVAKITIQKMSR